MAAKKQFVNPLTRSSEVELHVPTQPIPVSQPEDPTVNTDIPVEPKLVKEKGKTFEATHQRFTAWIDRELKKQLDELLDRKGGTKTELLNEAVTLLLHKHRRKPYTRRTIGEK